MPIANINTLALRAGITLDNHTDLSRTGSTRVYSREDFANTQTTHYNRPEMYAQPAFRLIDGREHTASYIGGHRVMHEIRGRHADDIDIKIFILDTDDLYYVRVSSWSRCIRIVGSCNTDTLIKVIDAVASL